MSSLRKWRFAMVTALLIAGAGCGPTGEQALVEGDRLLQAHRVKEAVPLLERAVEAMPQNAQALNRLGLAYQYTGRYEEARKQYLKALNFDLNLFEAHHNLGVLYLETGKYPEAERSLRIWLGRHPEDADALAQLGFAQYKNSAVDAAEQSLAAAAKASPNSPDVWNTLGLISIRKRRYHEAQQRLGYGLKLDEKNAALHLNMAVLLQEYLADRPGAAAHYRSFLELSPNAPEAPAARAALLQLEPPPVQGPRSDATNHSGKPLTGAQPSSSTNLTSGPRSPPTNAPPEVSSPKPLLADRHPPANAADSSPALTATNQSSAAPKTNSTPRTARSPEPPATNAHSAKVEPTNSVQVITDLRTNAAPSTIASFPTPKREIVRVDEEPPPVAAHDLPPPPKPAPVPIVAWTPSASLPPPAASNPTNRPQGASSTNSAATPATTPETTVGETAESPKPTSFWSKVNPVRWGNPANWFKGDPKKDEPAEAKSTPHETPKPPPSSPSPLPPAATNSTVASLGPATLIAPIERPAVESKPALPPKPIFPRYQRRGADRLAEGDHAAAEPEFARGADAQQQRDWVGAIAAYRRALQLDPAYFDAHYNLCIAALEQGDLNLALIASDNALLLQPDNENARLNFAVTLQRSGYPVDAVEQYERVLAKRPNDPSLEFAAASICARDLKDNPRARAHYERVLAINPQHPKAAAIRQWLAANN